MALLDFAKKKKNQIVDAYKNDASTLGIAKNTVKGLGSAFNQVVAKGPAAAYYDANPEAALNVGRATAFRMPEEIAGNLFSGVKDFAQTAGGAIGEGLAYGIDKNVRDQYKAGNLDILPTVSNVSPLQMIGKTARAGLEVATPKFLSGAARAKDIPEAATLVQRLVEYGKRALRAAPAGYAYDLSNKVAEGGRINDSSTYKPGMGTAMSMVFGAGTKPSIDASKTFAKEVADSPSGQFVSKVNEVLPQIPGAARNSFSNRQPGAIRKERIPSHYIPSRRVPVSEQDGKPGVFPELPKDSRFTGRVRNDGIDPVTLATRFSVKTERMLPEQIVERGRRKPTLSDLGREVVDALPRPGMNIQAIDDPLLQEARKYKTAEEFRKAMNQSHLMDLSNQELHRWGRAIPSYADEPYTDIGQIIQDANRPGSYLSTMKYSNPVEYRAVSSPKDTITIYRAVPENAGDEIRIGDYVALDKRYAQMHLESVLEGEQGVNGKIISKTVPKKDVIWGNADFTEWAYSPKDLRDKYPSLTDLWNKSHGSPKTLKDLGKELVDAIPRPGMSIQDVSGGRATPPLPGKIDEIVKAEADAMIDMYRSAEGVKMLNTGYDYLPGSGEFNRVSSNPRWYRDFFKENGRAPGKKEILAMAKDALEKGRGYLQDEFDKAKNPTPDDVNESLLSFGRRQPTKAEVFQQPPRIFKNRTYPQSEPLPGSITAPSRTLPAGAAQLMLPPGPAPTMRPTQAKQFISKYGQAPQVKTEIKSTRPMYVGESGQASFSRNKAGAADIAENLGDTEFSDIGIVAKGNLDIVRNFRNFFGKRSQEFVDRYITPFQQAKDVMYRNLEKEAYNLDKVIVKGLGIERGSKESAAVQEFGEGLRSKESLVKEFGKEKASSIIKADKWFRAQYDRMLAEVNKARSYVYPNQPDKQIQRRGDYYRHFRELQDGFQGLANIFETPAGIDNKLAGISDRTKPQSKWLSLAQKRLGMKTDVDAVGGFIDYIGAAEYAKNVDPAIHRFRQLAAEVADQGNRTGKDYNNFVGYLERIADHLSGKTNPLDRGVQEFTGRTAFRVVDWLNRRVKANTILGNASSSLAQIFALPAGISSAGEGNFLKGTKRLYQSIGKDDAVMRQSQFLRERYFNALDKFDKGIFNNTKKFAVWMVTALDEMATKAIWNSHYEKALSEGIQNPIKYADEITGNIVGRRGIGETPLLQQSKTFQMAAPFQLEVANAWPLMKELSDAGKGKILKLFLYTYLFNQGVKAIRGSDVAFDPINASIEGYQSASEEDTLGGKMAAFGGRMAGEVLSNVPLGQTMAGLYPEYGAKDVMGSGVNLPTREKLFGKGDPTRFGSGLLVAKGLQDPLYKVLMPFGGAQVERTIEGLKAWGKGYKENSSGKVQYPVEQNLRNFIQGGVFGPSSVPEAQSYYKNEQTPLGEVQSEKFKMGGGKQYYDKVMNDRKAEKEKTEKANGLVGVANAGGEGQVRRLSNGKFYIQKLDKEFDTEAKAKRAIALDEWMKSDQETLEYDGKFYTKDDSTDQGYRTQSMKEKKKADTTKDIALSTEKMQRYKAEKDIESWKKEANILYQKLWKKLQSETDEAERLKIENDMNTLAVQANKYKSFNGFTKPKKANKVKVPSINDADFIVKKMTSRLRPLRAFGRSRTSLASVARPNIRRPKRLS